MILHRSYGIKDRVREGKRRLRMQLRLNKLDRELEAIAARQKLKEAQKFRNDVLEEVAEELHRLAGEKPQRISRQPFACGRWSGLTLAERHVRKLKEKP